LLSASSTEEVHAAYGALENRVVAQGTVYSAAEPVVTGLIAAFTDPRIRQVKIAALQIMYQVLAGLPDASRSDGANVRLIDRCRGRAREGLWLLVHEALTDVRESSLDVVELLDEGRAEQVRLRLSRRVFRDT
jgi:hypothetical protein